MTEVKEAMWKRPLPREIAADQEDRQGVRVFSVRDAHALVQLIGWMKYTGSVRGTVLFRGQARFYPTLVPSAFRARGKVGAERLSWRLNEYISELFGGPCRCADAQNSFHLCLDRSTNRSRKSPLVLGTSRAVTEPLLQHYGIPTRWVDLVDNVWIALWFACHRQVTVGRHAYHERRSIAEDGAEAKAYIAVVDTGDVSPTALPGLQRGAMGTELVDLRRAVSSVYLRPHAQHGLLLTVGTGTVAERHGRLSSCLRAIVELPLSDALEWLGSGLMTSSFVLFPSAVVDEGFRRLLQGPAPQDALGSFTLYGPGR